MYTNTIFAFNNFLEIYYSEDKSPYIIPIKTTSEPSFGGYCDIKVELWILKSSKIKKLYDTIFIKARPSKDDYQTLLDRGVAYSLFTLSNNKEMLDQINTLEYYV